MLRGMRAPIRPPSYEGGLGRGTPVPIARDRPAEEPPESPLQEEGAGFRPTCLPPPRGGTGFGLPRYPRSERGAESEIVEGPRLCARGDDIATRRRPPVCLMRAFPWGRLANSTTPPPLE